MLTGEFLRLAAARSPERLALVGENRQLSYAEFDLDANRLANALLKLGLGKNAKVAIMSENRPAYAIAYFACARSGCVSAHVSTRSTGEELAYVLKKVGVRALLFETGFAPVVEQATKEYPDLEAKILIDEPLDDPLQLPNCFLLSDLIAGESCAEPAVQIQESDPVAVTFTGGTTGFPKAVQVSHKARYAAALAAAVDFGLDERDVVLAATPLFHTAGLFVWFATAVMLGARIVMEKTWCPLLFMDTVEKHGVTAAFLVPSQLSDLIAHPDFSAARLAKLAKINYAGAPMGRDLFERLRKALPLVEFTENYGQSEACPITIRCPWHSADKLGSVGRPAFNVEVEVFDTDGRPVPRGKIGEIATRGDLTFDRYYSDAKQTERVFRLGGGWLCTGDVGYIDGDGFLFLLDRSEDMLISGGENIYPVEIENVLHGHPAVTECAVFGIPSKRWGEVVAAHVVIATGAQTSKEELADFCAERIARFKCPKSMTFVEELPRTALGKIRKGILRQPYWVGHDRNI